MRFAYADPPYLGTARKHYGHRHKRAAAYDRLHAHEKLVDRLCTHYPAGWALSCSSTSLRQILTLCPDDVRVLAWVKPWVPFKKGVGVAHAWEPVIVRGGRPRTRVQGTIVDWLKCPIAMRTGLKGAKPEAFTRWLCQVLNVQAGDTIVDLFPGSGSCRRVFTAVLEGA